MPSSTAFPLPPAALVRLADGRNLEYASYGDEAGLPLLFFHGFIGSIRQAAFAHPAACAHGLRLVAVNRPGVGRSTPVGRRTIREHVADVVQLADQLGLERFGVIGVSGGAPYALACLSDLPHRVRVGSLLSGLGPVADPGLLKEMDPTERRILLLARWMPWVVQGLLGVQLRCYENSPEELLATLMRRWPAADQEVFGDAWLRTLFLEDVRQVLRNVQAAALLAAELGLYSRWGFRLEDVPPTARVLMWHGSHDAVVPPLLARHVAGRLSGAELTLYPGGHFMAVHHTEEIVTRTRDALVAAAARWPTATLAV
ncbi:MAG: alpha/beta hydrolase [Gemmataceae bacterium]